jgi:predicted nuclease of predicted toxin-antitoxin system
VGNIGEDSYSDIMKFLIDMALSPKTVRALRDFGYEAVRVNELGMAKSKDKEILAYAEKKGLVVITADLDFGDILAYTGYRKPSVIIFRLKVDSVIKLDKLATVLKALIVGELGELAEEAREEVNRKLQLLLRI